jgi:hypothetical protein
VEILAAKFFVGRISSADLSVREREAVHQFLLERALESAQARCRPKAA